MKGKLGKLQYEGLAIFAFSVESMFTVQQVAISCSDQFTRGARGEYIEESGEQKYRRRGFFYAKGGAGGCLRTMNGPSEATMSSDETTYPWWR